nr:hypothetical protein BaRGS_010732 [Batillaria attramentaria]
MEAVASRSDEDEPDADAAGFIFRDWIKESGLNETTMAALRKEDLTARQALLLLTPEDITSLGLTLGQRKMLEVAIGRIKQADAPPRPARTAPGDYADLSAPTQTGNNSGKSASFTKEPPYQQPTALPRERVYYNQQDRSTANARSGGGDSAMTTRPSKTSLQRREAGKRMLRGLYDFKSAEEGELAFSKDELMELLDDSGDWWLAKRQDGSKGYIPYNFVALENTIESMDWFFGTISRPESEQILRADSADVGSFLVRESLRHQGSFVLSVRAAEDEKEDKPVKHYMIRGNQDGVFYVSSKITFTSLDKLIEHYKVRVDGLVCRLTEPCPRPKPVQQDLSKETEDMWEIDRSTLKFGEKPIGGGQYGEVWKGTWKGQTDVAIKTMKETMAADKFLAEAAIMKKFKHPNLVKLYAVCTKEEPFLIVTEYMCNGSLLDYLRCGEGRHGCGLTELVDIAAQIAGGMAYLEDNGFIHRDLAARNILVGDLNTVKVADFGFARLIEEGEYNPKKGTKVPIRWTAPEVMFENRFTIKSDVWSFGVLLHEIMTKGQKPYLVLSNQEVMDNVRRGYRMPKDDDVPDRVYEMMLRCWDADDKRRPSFARLQQFFVEYCDDAYTYT